MSLLSPKQQMASAVANLCRDLPADQVAEVLAQHFSLVTLLPLRQALETQRDTKPPEAP